MFYCVGIPIGNGATIHIQMVPWRGHIGCGFGRGEYLRMHLGTIRSGAGETLTTLRRKLKEHCWIGSTVMAAVAQHWKRQGLSHKRFGTDYGTVSDLNGDSSPCIDCLKVCHL